MRALAVRLSPEQQRLAAAKSRRSVEPSASLNLALALKYPELAPAGRRVAFRTIAVVPQELLQVAVRKPEQPEPGSSRAAPLKLAQLARARELRLARRRLQERQLPTVPSRA